MKGIMTVFSLLVLLTMPFGLAGSGKSIDIGTQKSQIECKGDMNGNGKVDNSDLKSFLSYLATSTLATSITNIYEVFWRADMDDDGILTEEDLWHFKNILAGIEKTRCRDIISKGKPISSGDVIADSDVLKKIEDINELPISTSTESGGVDYDYCIKKCGHLIGPIPAVACPPSTSNYPEDDLCNEINEKLMKFEECKKGCYQEDGTKNLDASTTKIAPSVEDIEKTYPSLVGKRYISDEALNDIEIENIKIVQEEKELENKIQKSKFRLLDLKKKSATKDEKIEVSKEHLNNIIDVLLKKLDKLEYKTYSNSFISDWDANIIITWIANEREALLGLKAEINGFDEVTAKYEINPVIKKLRMINAEIKSWVNRHNYEFTNFKIENLLSKITFVSGQLEIRIAYLEAEGIDVGEAVKVLNELRQDLEMAKQNLIYAKGFLIDGNYRSTKEHYGYTINHLQHANSKLGKLTSFVKNQNIDLGTIKKTIDTVEEKTQQASVLPSKETTTKKYNVYDARDLGNKKESLLN